MHAVILASRPDRPITAQHFEVTDVPILEVQEGQVLIRNLFLSLDPGVRLMLGAQDDYIAGLPAGEPMVALAVGEVTASQHPNFQKGDVMVGRGLTLSRA